MLPIPGTTKLHRVEENLGCFKVHLSEEERAEIGAILKDVEGERYADMSTVNK